MQAGGSAILLIPSALGYGGQSHGPIPANAVLIFNVQMVSFH
jgi:FKBP-type peptidyl-prolyl cis-trans isomerase